MRPARLGPTGILVRSLLWLSALGAECKPFEPIYYPSKVAPAPGAEDTGEPGAGIDTVITQYPEGADEAELPCATGDPTAVATVSISNDSETDEIEVFYRRDDCSEELIAVVPALVQTLRAFAVGGAYIVRVEGIAYASVIVGDDLTLLSWPL